MKYVNVLLIVIVPLCCLGQPGDASQPFVNANNFYFDDINYLQWKTTVYSYEYGLTMPFRCEFNSVNFMGDEGVTGVGVFFQNVSHYGETDACSISIDANATGIWFTGQSDLVPSDYGVALTDTSGGFQRAFTMIDGMTGIYGRQVYSTYNLEYPEITWLVVKGEIKNGILAEDQLTKSTDGSCEWIDVDGLFREWNFYVSLNNDDYINAARFYVPVEYGDRIRPYDPIVLHPEYQSSCFDDLSRSRVTSAYYDFAVKSDSLDEWTYIRDFNIVRYYSPCDNVDPRFGYDVNHLSQKIVLISTCGVYSALKEDTVVVNIGVYTSGNAEWHIGVQATIDDQTRDLDNCVGAKNDATFGYDPKYDLPDTIRSDSNYIRLYILEDESIFGECCSLATSYIPNLSYSDTAVVWNICIDSDVANELFELRFNIEAFVPDVYDILLYGEQNEAMCDLRSNNVVNCFTDSVETLTYQLIVGNVDCLVTVSDLTIVLEGDSAILNWSSGIGKPMYKVYRGENAGFDPTPETLLGTTETNSYTDESVVALPSFTQFYMVIVEYAERQTISGSKGGVSLKTSK